MSFWRRPFSQRQVASEAPTDQNEVVDGGLRFVAEKAGNDAGTWTYQEASGAPVEVVSPMGYNVGPVTIIFLNISMMIGTGVYSTRKAVSKPR